MFRDPLTMLNYEAKRRPEIAQLVAQVDCLSEDDIQRAPVKLPWVRQALLALKHQHATAIREAEIDRVLETASVCSQLPDPVGAMHRWQGPPCFIKIGRTQLEVQDGQLVWFDGNGVWLDTIYTTVIDPVLHQYTVLCGQVTRSAYIRAVRDRRQQLSLEVVQSPMEKVRIYRPA